MTGKWKAVRLIETGMYTAVRIENGVIQCFSEIHTHDKTEAEELAYLLNRERIS